MSQHILVHECLCFIAEMGRVVFAWRVSAYSGTRHFFFCFWGGYYTLMFAPHSSSISSSIHQHTIYDLTFVVFDVPIMNLIFKIGEKTRGRATDEKMQNSKFFVYTFAEDLRY